MSPRLSRAERRDQTRKELLTAAAAVFAERGYHEASIDAIADAAGFTKGAVYAHFGSKEDLFLALLGERQAQMLDAFFALTDAPAAERAPTAGITDVFRRLSPTTDEFGLWQEFEAYARRQPEVLARLRADNDAMFGRLVALVEGHWKALGVAPTLPAAALARLYVAIFDGLARQRAIDSNAVPDELFAQLVEFVERAADPRSAKTRRSR